MLTTTVRTANHQSVASFTIEDRSDCQRQSNLGDRLVALGWELNANQHRLMHLTAEFAASNEWHRSATAAHWIADQLDIEPSTAREWIRIGQALSCLPAVDAAFAAGEVSFSKVRVLTRWADADNEVELLAIAKERSASRLSVALAKALAVNEDDDHRDKRHHDGRSFSYYTNPEGMIVGTFRLPPVAAKQIIAVIEALVGLIARTPSNQPLPLAKAGPCPSLGTNSNRANAPADALRPAFAPLTVKEVTNSDTERVEDPPAGGSDSRPSNTATFERFQKVRTLEQLYRQRFPEEHDDWMIPSLAQQRADAFVALFTGLAVPVTTEIIVHVRGDGNTFDDGTPLTDHDVVALLPDSMVRAMIHDAERRPINASGRQRHPTTRQQRVVLERHNHECVDCGTTALIEIDHVPAYELSGRTIVEELEPRCAPCHRARHRLDPGYRPTQQRSSAAQTTPNHYYRRVRH